MKVIFHILERYVDYQPVQITDYVPYERVYQDYTEIQHTVDFQPVSRYFHQIQI